MSSPDPFEVTFREDTSEFAVAFQAMAGPCEALVQSPREKEAREIGRVVYDEAKRMEKKYSRYRDDNLIHEIHQHGPVQVDEETARLLDFANTAYELSEGDFDITSGVWRRIWDFTGDGKAPGRKAVKELLPKIGREKAGWVGKTLQVPEGMQIDFGGFGKEYAVDQALALVSASFDCPVLVNFGGDLVANRKPLSRDRWSVGIQRATATSADAAFKFESGAIATSGDANRFVMHKGKKLSHILNPRTGWPVSQAPVSVSVGMPSCLQAGLLSTMATLRGKNAERFLEAQEVLYWVQR